MEMPVLLWILAAILAAVSRPWGWRACFCLQSRALVTGAIIGAVVGIFFGLPGVLIGPFLGEVVGEFSTRHHLGKAGRAGIRGRAFYLKHLALHPALTGSIRQHPYRSLENQTQTKITDHVGSLLDNGTVGAGPPEIVELAPEEQRVIFVQLIRAEESEI